MLIDIWRSFRRIPLWVQIWVAGILMPINFLAVLFFTENYGQWVAILAIAGMLPNAVILATERGLSKMMAIPHVLIWTPLCLLLAWLLYGHFNGGPVLSDNYAYYLMALLIIDVISLGFDFPDTLKWLRGDRAIA
jgi:hypothetical protein